METSFFANTTEVGGEELPVEQIKDVLATQVEGFAGNPSAVPTCSTRDFLEQAGGVTDCANGSAVGEIDVYLKALDTPGIEPLKGAVFLLEPGPGSASKLGFWISNVPVTVDVDLSEEAPYQVVGASRNISQVLSFFGAELTLWGMPADPRHEEERGKCLIEGGKCPAETAEVPFLTLPRACGRPLLSEWAADPWPNPGAFVFGSAPSPEVVGCDKLSFGPEISAQATSRAAQSPSGLDFGLDVEDEGLVNPHEGALAASDIERAVVALPRGMTVNASQAEGLEVCSEAQLAAERSDSGPGEGCPQASKVGTWKSNRRSSRRDLKGGLYVAEPYANLAGNSLIAVYVVFATRAWGSR